MHELTLIPIAFLTSCLAGVMGMGGGILLIAVLPGLLPAVAIIPIHAATQLASNASRAFFGRKHIDWSLIPLITLGALCGALLGGELYQSLNPQWIPAMVGVFILLFTWLPMPALSGSGAVALFTLGFYQTGIGMLAGATGPVGGAVLMKRNTQRDWLVVNTAIYMTLNHLVRVVVFFAIGFSFAPWWELILGMTLAVVAGSWVGTRLRSRVPQLNFQRWFRILITLLAVRMIAMSWL